jgi:hypothetical protein
VTVMWACLSAAVTAGLTITDVLRPMTVAGAEVDVFADGALELVVLVVVPLPTVVPLVALLGVVPLLGVVLLFELPPHAATRRATMAIAPTAGRRWKRKDIRKGLAYLSESGLVGYGTYTRAYARARPAGEEVSCLMVRLYGR